MIADEETPNGNIAASASNTVPPAEIGGDGSDHSIATSNQQRQQI